MRDDRTAFGMGLSFGLIVGLLAAAIILDDRGIKLDSLVRAITALGVVGGGTIGGFALLYAKRQLVSHNRTARVDRAAAFARRFDDPSFAQLLQSAWSFAHVADAVQEEARWKEYRADGDEGDAVRRCVGVVINFFEELGMKYNRNLVDRDLVGTFFRYASLFAYRELRWLIERQEKLDPPWEGPEEWREMNQSLEESALSVDA